MPEISSNMVSTFHPLHPGIAKRLIMSGFQQDEQQLPSLDELRKSEQDTIEKAEFNTKKRKKLAKEGEARKDGSFPIRNQSDLKNAIHDVGRANNPAGAKAWIKKRAKELNLEHTLPEDWHKAEGVTESVGEGPGIEGGIKKSGSGASEEWNHGLKPGDTVYHEKKPKKVTEVRGNSLTLNHDTPVHVSKVFDKEGKSYARNVEKSEVEKAFENLFQPSDPVESAFNTLMKGGEGSKGGKIIGHTKSGKPIYSHFEHPSHEGFSREEHLEAMEKHDQLRNYSKDGKTKRHHGLQAKKHFNARFKD